MVHSLDHASSTLNDPKNFKSRIDVQEISAKHLQSIVRRLYRLFSHTYFHHEELFNKFEEETHACERFTYFTKEYKMMPSDLYIIEKDVQDK